MQDMSFLYEERTIDSPSVSAVWRTEDTSDGMYLAAADGACDSLPSKGVATQLPMLYLNTSKLSECRFLSLLKSVT